MSYVTISFQQFRPEEFNWADFTVKRQALAVFSRIKI